MSSQSAHIYSLKDLSTIISSIWTGKALLIKWSVIGDKRSNSANGLYWLWLTTMAESFTKKEERNYKRRLDTYGKSAVKGDSYTKDQIHQLMCFKFLKTEDVVIRDTVIPNQLRSTAKLSVPEFCEYMTQIEAWAMRSGIPLPHPPANEYTEYWQAQQ